MTRRGWPDRRALRAAGAGCVISGVVIAAAAGSVSYSSRTDFCMSCHEMRVVAEQGWMRSSHYHNDKGVVADCADCHVPHGIPAKLWVKARDGTKDILVHFLGESDPARMDWDHLARTARGKIHDSACRTCHSNLTPDGASVKMWTAHREYERTPERKRCLDCHAEEFHGAFWDRVPLLARTPDAGGES